MSAVGSWGKCVPALVSSTDWAACLLGRETARETRCSHSNQLRERDIAGRQTKRARQEEGTRGCGRRERSRPNKNARALANPNMASCLCPSPPFTLSYGQRTCSYVVERGQDKTNESIRTPKAALTCVRVSVTLSDTSTHARSDLAAKRQITGIHGIHE